MMRVGLACLVLVLACLLLASPATAQELTSGTLAGKVLDPGGRPIAGATVIVTSSFGTKTAETDANGHFILPFLRPASYTVRVEASGGFSTVIQNEVEVGLNQRKQIDFTMEPGKTETVTVTSQAPLVDTRSTSSGTNLKYSEFADAVPLSRSFTDTYAVAPGVVSGLGTGQGNVSISGGSGLENSYLIDGVNVTNTGYGGIGAYNIMYGSLGTGVTSEFLDEVQIKTGGFDAEYGQAMGGIINTIVKSGTNDVKGSVSWFASPGSLRSAQQDVRLDAGNSNTVGQTVNDFAFTVGGPIKKDEAFYFFAYNPVLTTQERRANSLANPAYTAASAGLPSFDESTAGGFGVTDPLAFPSSGQTLERRRAADNYAAKISWMVSPKHQLELTLFGDPATGATGPQRDVAPRYTDFASGGGESRLAYGSNNQALKWNAVLSPRFFLEGQIARHDGRFRETSEIDQVQYTDLRNILEFIRGANSYDPGGGPVPLTLSPVTNFRGGVGFISNQDDRNTQYSIKVTNVFGRHEVKYGVQHDDISYRDAATYTGSSIDIGLPVSDLNGAPVDADLDGKQDLILMPTRGGALVSVRNGLGNPTVAFDSANRYRVTRASLVPRPPATNATDEALFVQDTWSITPRLTVKAGLRYSEEKLEGAGDYTLPFSTQTISFFGAPLRIFTAGTSTYAPSGYTFSGNWAPRLGVSWDVLGNGRSRLYANWGRYFERVPNDLAVRAFSSEVSVSQADFSDRALTAPRFITAHPPNDCVDGGGSPVTCDPSAAVFTQGIAPTGVVPGTKLPYEDELSAGFAFEMTPTSSFEVRGIFRTQGRVLEDVQVNSIEQIVNFYYGYAFGYPYDPFGGSPSTPQSTTFPARTFDSNQIANPGTNRVPKGGLYGFPKPQRHYKALELVYTRRFSNNWSLYANYRLARLDGNYEGLFRNDNGQSDPNYSSLYDFPDSPLTSGQFLKGALPADVMHVLHLYPSYTFASKLRVGANLSWSTGVPRTSLLAHPIYQNSGEIPGKDPVYAYWADPGTGLILRTTNNLPAALNDPDAINPGAVFLRSYTPVERGNLGRTPSIANLDLHVDYPLAFKKSQLSLMLDVFNATNSRKVTGYDDNVEITAGVTDPDYGKPVSYQLPRSIRLAARWSF